MIAMFYYLTGNKPLWSL